MALLREAPEGPEVLLIERTERPGDPWSGHVALPGGRRDSADPGAGGTALRELQEEVGVSPDEIEGSPRYVGRFATQTAGLEVALFVALERPGAARPRVADPREVASLFWMPLAHLGRTEPVVRHTDRGPREVTGVRLEGRVLWGLTLRMLLELSGRLHAPAGA